MTNDNEPPSSMQPPTFMIGQDSRGNWVVQDQAGIRGGLFVDREQALRYVRFESGQDAAVVAGGCFELDMSAPAVIMPQSTHSAPRQRRVA